MNIEQIIKLGAKPGLYEQGTSVMWTDPHISQQLLALHIDPAHDIASRNNAKIARITDWILSKAGDGEKEILDLGCGPGLYAGKLVEKGHKIIGIDFSENSIRYAIRQAQEKNLNIDYITMNYLEMDYDEQFDLIILIYLDFCALLPSERDLLLGKIHKALKKGGVFICDVVNEKNLEQKTISQSWEVTKSGFWRKTPYLALTNGYHFPEAKVLANQHLVIGEDDSIESYVFWSHYYDESDFTNLLLNSGFADIKGYDNILPEGDCWNGDNVTFYVSRKN